MHFDYISAMHHRLSVKVYHDSFLEENKRTSIQKYIDLVGQGPFLSNTHVYLVDTIQLPLDQLGLLHVPNYLVHAYTFLVGAVISSEYDLEDFGYQFEKITLFATSIKLGTHWIGTGFNRNRFAQLIHTKDFELIPCISPVGLPEKQLENQGIDFNLMSIQMKKSKNKNQAFYFHEDFTQPLRFDVSNPFLFALSMIGLAPSFMDKQPCRVVMTSSPTKFHFYIHHSMSEIYLPQCEEMIDLQRVDMGAAMCHFELTLHQLGIHGQWQISDPDLPLPSRNTEYVSTWILSSD